MVVFFKLHSQRKTPDRVSLQKFTVFPQSVDGTLEKDSFCSGLPSLWLGKGRCGVDVKSYCGGDSLTG